jgi:hypothetical protein
MSAHSGIKKRPLMEIKYSVTHLDFIRTWPPQTVYILTTASPSFHANLDISKDKCKFQPRTGHEGPGEENRHSFTPSLTSTLDGVNGQHHTPVNLPTGKPRYPSYERLGGPQSRSGRVRKISPQPEFDPRAVQPVKNRYNLEIGLEQSRAYFAYFLVFHL